MWLTGYIGLDQVNIVLPPQLDYEGVVSLTITVGNNTSNTVTFLVNSLPANSIQLVSLTLSTNETTGGNMVTGTLSLNGLAPSTGIPVTLRTSLPTVTVPSVVAIPQGQTSAGPRIGTATTAATQTDTIAAMREHHADRDIADRPGDRGTASPRSRSPRRTCKGERASQGPSV